VKRPVETGIGRPANPVTTEKVSAKPRPSTAVWGREAPSPCGHVRPCQVGGTAQRSRTTRRGSRLSDAATHAGHPTLPGSQHARAHTAYRWRLPMFIGPSARPSRPRGRITGPAPRQTADSGRGVWPLIDAIAPNTAGHCPPINLQPLTHAINGTHPNPPDSRALHPTRIYTSGSRSPTAMPARPPARGRCRAAALAG
jgi:hypothetical protein